MPKSLKQKREEALARMHFRFTNPVPSGQDRRVKKNPRTKEEAINDAARLQALIVRS